MNAEGSALLLQLVWQSPVLLAYLAIMVGAMVNLPRYPKPSRLVLFAVGMMLALALGQQIFQAVVLSEHAAWGIQPAEVGLILGVTGFVLNVFRVVPLALLVMAAYTGSVPALQQPWTGD
jgi:hypothetical protein